MRTAAARAELPAHCKIHDKQFVRFSSGKVFSFGCPECVRIIREQVRAMRGFRKNFPRRGREATGSGRLG